MIGLAIRFPAGRFHATPWGAHVNEASVEWPPSPWRLLRALASAWHRTAPGLAAGEVGALLDALAAPPRYRLPAAAPAHTRHYMPDGAHRREVELSQNLVFDAFLRVSPRHPLTVLWDAALPPSGLETLRTLAAGVTYLGRAESWCEVEVIAGEARAGDVVPVEGTEAPAGGEVVRLLVPARPLDLRALEVTTADLQGGRARRRDPPGTRWARYSRPAGWARVRRPPADRAAVPVAAAVLWALDGSPPPLLTRVEDVVDAVRGAVRLRETAETGALHVLAFPSDLRARPPRIDRLALWAERGLSARELERACSLGPFAVPGLGGELVPLLLGWGRPEELGGPLFGPARAWRSVTPVVPWQPVRPGGPAEGDPARLVAAALGPRHAGVRVAGPAAGPAGWLEFRRGAALGARVEFPEPVAGPVLAARQRPGFGLFLCEP